MTHRLSLVVFTAAVAAALLAPGCAPTGTKTGAPPTQPAGGVAGRLVAMAVMDPVPSVHGAELHSLAGHGDPLIRAAAARVLGAWAAQGDPRLVLPATTHGDTLVRSLAQTAYMAHNPQAMGVLDVEGHVIEVPREVLLALEEINAPGFGGGPDRGGQGIADPADLVAAREDELRPYLDASPEEAVLAAGILAHASDLAARRWLLRLTPDHSEAVLAAAAEPAARPAMAIGSAVIPMVVKAGPVARRAAARALVLHPDPYFVPLLVDLLDDQDVGVRRNAIRAMGNLGAAAPVRELADVLDWEPPTPKQGQAPPLPPGEVFDAVRALGKIGTPAAVDALRRHVQRGTGSDQLLIQVLLSIGSHAEPADVPWIAEHLRSGNPLVRASAARALGDIGHPSAQAALMHTLDDETPLVRASTARAIGRVGSQYGARHLVEMLDDPSPQVRAMAIQGLGIARYRDAGARLSAIAARPVPADRAPVRMTELHELPELAAVMALGRIATAEAVQTLVGLLESPSWIKRATAIRAIETAGAESPDVIEALYARLDDRTNLVRGQALVTLKAFGETFPPGYFQTH